MSRNYKAIALAAMLAATAAACSDASKSAEPSSPAAAPDAKKVDESTAAKITGRVTFEGTHKPKPVLNMASDPACASANQGQVTSESILVDNGGLQNVFVYIKDGLGNKYLFDTPTEPVVLDQKGCHYTPHVVGLRATQPLQVVNSDNTLHNVHGMPEKNREFNQGQPVPGMKNTVTFNVPEVLIPFKCDVHGWMNAYVGVVSHPYFAVSGKDGKFELRAIAGHLRIEAVTRNSGADESVTLGEKDAKEITLTFKPAV